MTEPNDRQAVLPADQLEQLRSSGRQRQFRKGDTLFVEGSPSESAVVIDRGKVKVTSAAENGRAVVLALRGADELVGEFGCIVGAPRSASVTALTPVTASFIPSSRFRHMLENRSDILLNLLTTMIMRVRESDRRQLEFGAYHGTDRAIRFVLALAEQQGEPGASGDGTVVLEMIQRDLAEAAGLSRETMVRALNLLARNGLISRSKGLVVIHDLDLLRTVVSEAEFG